MYRKKSCNNLCRCRQPKKYITSGKSAINQIGKKQTYCTHTSASCICRKQAVSHRRNCQQKQCNQIFKRYRSKATQKNPRHNQKNCHVTVRDRIHRRSASYPERRNVFQHTSGSRQNQTNYFQNLPERNLLHG